MASIRRRKKEENEGAVTFAKNAVLAASHRTRKDRRE
jgi:hypothetical protein